MYLLRLKLQHKHITNVVCDGRLVFDERIKLDERSWILDSGTGTGELTCPTLF